MAGWAAGIGGAGNAAGDVLQKRNQQVRSILEQQREGYAALLSKQAEEEGNPDYRNQLLKLSADAISGQPLHKIIPAHQKLMDSMNADHQLIGQILPMPQQPQRTAGPAAPGETPGTGTIALPPDSPVSPSQQTGAFSRMLGLQNPAPQSTPQPQPQGINQGGGSNVGGGPGITASVQQAQPNVTVTPQTIQPGQRTREIVSRYIPMIQGATPALRPHIQDAMNKEIAAIAPLESQALRMSQYQDLLGDPNLRSGPMDPRMYAAMEARGFTPPPFSMGMANAMFSPVHMGNMTGDTIWQNWPDIAQEHNIPKGGSPVDVWVNKITQQPVLIGGKAVRNNIMQGQDQQGNPVMMEANPYMAPGAIPSIGGATPTPASANQPRNMGVDQTGHELVGSMNQLNAGSVTRSPGQSPATLPTTHTSIQNVQGYDANGNPATLRIPTTSTTQRGGSVPPVSGGDLTVPPSGAFPGFSVPPAGTPYGTTSIEKPLTPQQQTVMEQKVQTLDLALGRANYIHDHIDVLNSMIDAGKIMIATNPYTGALIVSRIAGLTPEQAKFAAEFQNLTEDINLLRGPLGSTGFRGPEAFQALQAQKGNLMARPEVTKTVLENAIQALQAQRNPMAQRLKISPTPSGQVPPVGKTRPPLSDFERH